MATKKLPTVAEMDEATLSERIIGTNLSTAKQRYRWDNCTPIGTKNRRGWRIIGVTTENVSSRTSFIEGLNALVQISTLPIEQTEMREDHNFVNGAVPVE